MPRFKLLILLCAITHLAFAGPVADLRIQGSNTIGANLGPAPVSYTHLTLPTICSV